MGPPLTARTVGFESMLDSIITRVREMGELVDSCRWDALLGEFGCSDLCTTAGAGSSPSASHHRSEQGAENVHSVFLLFNPKVLAAPSPPYPHVPADQPSTRSILLRGPQGCEQLLIHSVRLRDPFDRRLHS